MLYVKELIFFALLQAVYSVEENHVLTVCPDGITQCPISGICCELGKGRYGCCPLTDENCCSDGVHCCPNGYKCEADVCTLGNKNMPAYKYTKSTNGDHDNTACPDGSTCPGEETCCGLGSGEYGCCPLSDATCCSDKLHCCPKGYTCNGDVCTLGNKNIPAYKHTKSKIRDSNNTICPDGSICPGEETCCILASGKYGCCIYPAATCCPDKLHCCPGGYTCNGDVCTLGSNKIPAYKHNKVTNKIPDNTMCPDGSTCAVKRSCCPLATGQYGCCPYSGATCCSDKIHCCPDGYTCNKDSCTKGSSTIVFKKLTMSVEKDTKLQMESEDNVVINQKLH